uniref:Calcium homeostasis modulator family member 4 n=1 Tax=Callorhinchus milii TaxID=7868 RepID=A0A4W3HFR9_CALMI|eukprot:gi/632963413/ref/XP_007897865.1/ PREDICTED: protein FAM26D [Callorhinchus milii]
MPFSTFLSFFKAKQLTLLNSAIALLTVFGTQAFTFFAFKCPCKPALNLYYSLPFMGVPALVLMFLGYSMNSLTWKLIMSFRQGTYSKQKHSMANCKLICFIFCRITGTAMVAPITWLSVTLLNGTFYSCGFSEFLSVDNWKDFENINLADRRDILSRLPCAKMSIKEIGNISEIRNEATRILMFQSQVCGWGLIASVAIIAFLSVCIPRFFSPLSFLHLTYWTEYLENEDSLFQETVEKHSRLYALKQIKKFFGFIPEEKLVQKIRLPSIEDWRMISGINVFSKMENDACQYSLLHTWASKSDNKGLYVPVDDVVTKE